MQNKTTVTICGREFKIVSDDSGEYIHQLAYELNERIKQTSAAYIGLPTSPATALTALMILDELTKKSNRLDETAAELAERCDEDKAAVSRTLEFLLQNGYVTTEAVSRRYRSPLYLTDRGREVFAALQARIASMEDAASMGLTEEQRSKMYAALELICGNLERLCAAEQEDTL